MSSKWIWSMFAESKVWKVLRLKFLVTLSTSVWSKFDWHVSGWKADFLLQNTFCDHLDKFMLFMLLAKMSSKWIWSMFAESKVWKVLRLKFLVTLSTSVWSKFDWHVSGWKADFLLQNTFCDHLDKFMLFMLLAKMSSKWIWSMFAESKVWKVLRLKFLVTLSTKGVFFAGTTLLKFEIWIEIWLPLPPAFVRTIFWGYTSFEMQYDSNLW